MLKTYCITVTGLVQGVGFRPFVYNLATKFSLKGTVSNNQMGLVVFVTGLQSVIDEFYNALVQNPPPVSRIKSSLIYQIDLRAFSDFKIIPSNKNGRIDLPLTPDFAICEDCKNDLLNPKNKRYQYPFTTCVNCGPRWAITKTFPFERNHTSIDDFKMCDSCQTEYVSPADRRFHSQTNTCNLCGVSLFLTDNKGIEVKMPAAQLFKKIVQLLSDGAIIAIKNTSGYLL
ncbi:MAG: carbamoyltransferase HypF, partial [Zetaproteobacteria bacterium]|nr:carbamoyltransferase HypF [Flavobacteriales bacterium]